MTSHPVYPADPTSVVTALLHAVDSLDWTGVREALADKVTIDYTSLFGGEVETISSDELMDRWRGLLPGFDATQHLTGPILAMPIGSDEVRATTQVRGYHQIASAEGGGVWMVAGKYDMRLVLRAGAWRIAAITLHVAYQEGNLQLPEAATERARVSPRPSARA